MSAISIKHHSVDRRFVAIGAVMLFLLSTIMLIVPQEDVDASVTTETVTQPTYTTDRTQVMYDDDDYPIGTFTITVTSTMAYVVLEDFHIFWACDEPGWKHGLIAENNRDLVIAENCRLPEPETKE